MIQQQTVLKVVDNSGAKRVRCIKKLGKLKQTNAKLGDIILVSILSLRNKLKKTSKVTQGSVFKALIMQTKRKTQKKDGSTFFYKENISCLINKQGKPVGTRILKPISKELRKKKFLRFVNISVGFF